MLKVFFSELDRELSKFMRRGLGENDLRVFLDTDRGPVDTNSVRDFQHPLEWSFILHKSVNDCATSVSNLILLFHRSSTGEDSALALAYCKTIKTPATYERGSPAPVNVSRGGVLDRTCCYDSSDTRLRRVRENPMPRKGHIGYKGFSRSTPK